VFLLAQMLVYSLVQGSKYALLATSFWLIYATTRTFHLAHAISYALAGYATVGACAYIGLPLWVGAIAAIIAAILFGCATEYVIYRPLRHRNATLFGLFLASLGVSTAGTSLIQIIFGPQVHQTAGFPNRTLELYGVTVTLLELSATVVSLLVVVAIIMLVSNTKIGHAITAVRTNPVLAMSVGIPIDRVALFVFGLASAMAAIAAYFEAINFVTFPTMGLRPVLYAIVAVFFGGVATVQGAALGGMALGFLLVFSGMFVSQNAGVILVFATLAATISFRPEGLLRGPRNI
jgi:branched-chain amino acid transport system permease protein